MPCYEIHLEGGGKAILCGELGPHCGDRHCADVGENLCDFPVGNGKTCDMPTCHRHSFEVAPNLHYCPAHTTMWREFKESGGVKEELENVVPYKQGLTPADTTTEAKCEVTGKNLSECVFTEIENSRSASEYEPSLIRYQSQCEKCGEIRYHTCSSS